MRTHGLYLQGLRSLGKPRSSKWAIVSDSDIWTRIIHMPISTVRNLVDWRRREDVHQNFPLLNQTQISLWSFHCLAITLCSKTKWSDVSIEGVARRFVSFCNGATANVFDCLAGKTAKLESTDQFMAFFFHIIYRSINPQVIKPISGPQAKACRGSIIQTLPITSIPKW